MKPKFTVGQKLQHKTLNVTVSIISVTRDEFGILYIVKLTDIHGHTCRVNLDEIWLSEYFTVPVNDSPNDNPFLKPRPKPARFLLHTPFGKTYIVAVGSTFEYEGVTYSVDAFEQSINVIRVKSNKHKHWMDVPSFNSTVNGSNTWWWMHYKSGRMEPDNLSDMLDAVTEPDKFFVTWHDDTGDVVKCVDADNIVDAVEMMTSTTWIPFELRYKNTVEIQIHNQRTDDVVLERIAKINIDY